MALFSALLVSRRSSPVWILGVALLTASSLSGCASNKSKYVPPLERAKAFQPDRTAYSTLGYRHEWTGFPTMTAGGQVEFFDILGDVLVVQESANTVTILETGNGATRWFEQVASPLTKFVGNLRDDKRLICTSESEVYFFDLETGNLVEKQKLDKVVNTSPVVVNDRFVFGTSVGELFGQLKVGGFRVWGNTVNGSLQSSPALIGNLLGYVSSRGEVIILDGVTGQATMRTRIYSGSEVAPVASDALMFVASNDHSLYAFSPSRPSPVWRYRTDSPLDHQPTYHDGKVYCAVDGTGLVAFDARGSNGDGLVLWTCKELLGTVIAMRKGKLVVWDGSTFALVDPADGSVVERVTLKNVAKAAADRFVDGNLYLVSGDGTVLKLIPKN